MVIDLRKGFGDFEYYKLFKFPDNTIKFQVQYVESAYIIANLRNSEDLFTLGLIIDFFEQHNEKVSVFIPYMIFQQDDRKFSEYESFGLKFVSRFLNQFKNVESYEIYHSHSDKVELIDKCQMIPNDNFINWSLDLFDHQEAIWVIPDSGAFKTQFKQISNLWGGDFITCMKSRSHETGEISTVVNCEDLQGRDCFIVDDICLGGRTFINIAQELKKKNCGKLYLIVSHGVFNNGIDRILEHFDCIYTTDSICTLEESNKLKIYKL